MTVRYSHPPTDGSDGTLLADHLDDVAARVAHVVDADEATPAGESLRTVIETVAAVHDLGKATTYFQQYLGTLEGSPPRDELRYHSPIGAFAAYYALDSRGFEVETCLAGMVAVARHHGRLPDVTAFVFDYAHRRSEGASTDQTAGERRQNTVAEQIVDIDAEAPTLAKSVLKTATNGAGSWAGFRDGFLAMLSDIEDHVGSRGLVPEPRTDPLSDSFYGLQLGVWSALVLADKTSAAGAPSGGAVYEGRRPERAALESYIASLEAGVDRDATGSRAERLNHYRGKAREEVQAAIPDFASTESRLATITLPTGMGKTLTGLSAAFSLRDRTDGDRVVYALPFTSIVDQVVDEVTTIFDTDVTGDLITAHHHLAETTMQATDADEADRSDDVAGMLAESWRAGMTVTTYVQLFESLAGPQNTQSMKLPALRNSVVVLDEPQSLPLDWWKLVPRLVTMLTEQFGATVIAMTATQPRLFDSEYELLDDPDQYFEAVQRVTYSLDESTERYLESQTGPKTHGEAATEIAETVRAGHSTLAICNTIDSARKLSERTTGEEFVAVGRVYAKLLADRGSVDEVSATDVAARVRSSGEMATLHLSTRIRPADRLALIETAKALTERGYPLAVISTQLIEAGVDISFDRVYRDLAPIDSIVQAAGRCNRSFERDTGTVTVWWLEPPGEQARTPSEAVYNRGIAILPTVAATLLSVRADRGELTETAVARTAVTEFFDRLREDKDVGTAEYVSWVDRAAAARLGDLSLIDERQAVDVLVTRTACERATVTEMRDA
ncbi:MAG: CRISPR-associated endonuclease Cas3'', partial [Halanaeroarchaeum sp.]